MRAVIRRSGRFVRGVRENVVSERFTETATGRGSLRRSEINESWAVDDDVNLFDS